MITCGELIKGVVLLESVGVSPEMLARQVTRITADSREVIPGSVFVAIRGEKADGRIFIPEAIRKGCLAVVIDRDSGLDDVTVPIFRVADCHEALGALAASWFDHPAEQMQLIGITGTNGKTTCSWLIEGMLVAAGFRPGVIGTVTYRYHDRDGKLRILQDAPLTTPDPLSLQQLFRTMADNGVTHVIVEVSSHALQQKRLGPTCFDVALFTNLSRDHLDYHQSMEHYFETKKQLFLRHLKQSGSAVIVVDSSGQEKDWGSKLVRAIPGISVIRCCLSGKCEVHTSALTQSVEGFQCSLHLKDENLPFSSPLTGGYNVLNVLSAAGVGLSLGLSKEALCKGLAQVSRVPGRLERVLLPGEPIPSGPAVFVDYAHTPDALENVLQTLQALATRRLICVFGCGGDRDRGKRPLMGEIAGKYAQAVIVTSDNPRTEDADSILDNIVEGVIASGKTSRTVSELIAGDQPADGYAVISDRKKAITAACSLAAPGDSILVAGKGHEQYQIIGTKKHFFDDRLAVTDALLCWNSYHLLVATGGRVVAGRQSTVFGSISTDSRKLSSGDVFVALSGENFDGHTYIYTAVKNGAAAIIAERIPADLHDGCLCIQVDDTLVALGQLAAYRRRLLGPQVKVAAITGSSGKTTVKELTAGIFAKTLQGSHTGQDPLLKTQGNFNNLVGLPLSLLPIGAGHRMAILEMGMNRPGEIARLAEIADPDIGCINNVHPAHLQGLGSLEGVAQAKGELFAGMRPDAVRVVNCDDPHVRAQARRFGGKQLGFAVTAAGRRHHPIVRVTRQRNLGEDGMRFTLHIDSWQARITVPVLGDHNVSNCAAAAAIAHAAGIDPETIVDGLQEYVAFDKRMSVSLMPGGLRVVNDAYNANPASMAAGLRTVSSFGRGRKHVAVLGDMLELGEASASLHRDIGALVAKLGYDQLAVTGAQAEVTARAAEEAGLASPAIHIFPEPRAIAAWCCQLLKDSTLGDGDWLLVKGSRGMRMETFIEELEQRLKGELPEQGHHVL